MRLAILVLSVACSLPVSATVVAVRGAAQSFASGTGATHSLSLSPSPTAGNALVVSVMTNGTTVSAISCTGASCTFGTPVTSGGAVNARVTTYAVLNVPASVTAISVTMVADFNVCVIAVEEFSGVATSSAGDGSAVDHSFSASITAPAVITTNAFDVIVGTGAYYNTISAGPTNSFTNTPGTPNTGQTIRMVMAYRIVSATGSYSTLWTQGSDSWEATTIALKASGGAAPYVVRRRFIQ